MSRGSWDSTPRPRRFPLVLVLIALLFLVPSVIGTVLRLVPPRDDATAMAASFIPFSVLGYAAALLVLLVAVVRARRRGGLALMATVVAGLLALQLAWLAPLFLPDPRPVGPATISLLSINLYNGRADPAEVRQAADRADVVVLVETTPEELAALHARGWATRFPYTVGGLGQAVSDTAIYSRFPLSGGRLIGATSFQQWIATAQVPDLGNVQIAAVHPCNPFCQGGRWASEHAALRATLRPYLASPVVVAGDFNAVDDHGPMQDLRSDGWRSATDLVGAGYLPTWPANRFYPPLIPLDHVLLSPRLTATAITTVRVDGTDHLGLLTTISGPTPPG